MTLSTPTHDSVPYYAASYRKGCMHTLIRQNRRIECQELTRWPMAKKGYVLRKI
jgi:hypothetical protein